MNIKRLRNSRINIKLFCKTTYGVDVLNASLYPVEVDFISLA
jgi:hypothetical protein